MFRSIDVIMIAVLVAIVSWTFKVKHDSRIALDRVLELEQKIAAEKTEIGLLKSDWSLLTNPARLQALVDRYEEELQLKQMEPHQIGREDELPRRKTGPSFENSPLFEDVVEVDKLTKTGSIDSGEEGQQ